MQVDASSTYFGPVPCPCALVPMGEKQEKEVFHEKHLMELDEIYEEPLERKDLKSPEFSMEKADLKRTKVFYEDLDLNSPSFSMEPSIKRRKKQDGHIQPWGRRGDRGGQAYHRDGEGHGARGGQVLCGEGKPSKQRIQSPDSTAQ